MKFDDMVVVEVPKLILPYSSVVNRILTVVSFAHAVSPVKDAIDFHPLTLTWLLILLVE